MPKKKRLLLVQPTRHQPKTAFSRLPPLHRADLEGPLRVRFGAFARLCRMSAICAFRPAGIGVEPRHSIARDEGLWAARPRRGDEHVARGTRRPLKLRKKSLRVVVSTR